MCEYLALKIYSLILRQTVKMNKKMNLNEVVAEKLRGIIQGKNLTHNQAADLLNIERSSFTRLQSGQKEISLSTVSKICEAFQVDLPYLFNLPSSSINNSGDNSETLSVHGVNTTIVINLPKSIVHDLRNQFINKIQ